MGGSPWREQRHAVPTTQGPADRVGQGGAAASGSRFTDNTNAWRANEVQWNVEGTEKLGLDFRRGSGRGRDMDDDTRDSISRLTTRVGMLMEDGSLDALTCGGLDSAEVEPMIDRLLECVQRMAKLLDAAKALLR